MATTRTTLTYPDDRPSSDAGGIVLRVDLPPRHLDAANRAGLRLTPGSLSRSSPVGDRDGADLCARPEVALRQPDPALEGAREVRRMGVPERARDIADLAAGSVSICEVPPISWRGKRFRDQCSGVWLRSELMGER